MKRFKHVFSNLPLQLRLILIFLLTSSLTLAVSLFLTRNLNRSLASIDSIYTSNNTLNEMSVTLEELQENIQTYLETKSTDSLSQYYYLAQHYRDLSASLNTQITDSRPGAMEKNIRNISETYLNAADQAIEAKRARNTGAYRSFFSQTAQYYGFLNDYIYSLNNQKFIINSENYRSLASFLRLLQRINVLLNIAVALFNILLITILVHQITKPILDLADASNKVARGDFGAALPAATSSDEIGIVTAAFNQMVDSIRAYIEQVKNSMEAEKKAQERELLMKTHLKDAQLKYYQAQINPHFLFNSLNAGAQMAMMEDAEHTCTFIQNMASFFRYSMKSLQTDVYLPEEIELVENYLSIMNVRFSGEIHFEKEILCDVSGVRVPCMIIQPAVENAVQYGIRDIAWEGRIRLIIDQSGDDIRIRVLDNGCGISRKRLEEIRRGHTTRNPSEKNSNGIGLGNVQERLKLYYNREQLFSIDSPGEGLGTTVTILIPQPEIPSTNGGSHV